MVEVIALKSFVHLQRKRTDLKFSVVITDIKITKVMYSIVFRPLLNSAVVQHRAQ